MPHHIGDQTVQLNRLMENAIHPALMAPQVTSPSSSNHREGAAVVAFSTPLTTRERRAPSIRLHRNQESFI